MTTPSELIYTKAHSDVQNSRFAGITGRDWQMLADSQRRLEDSTAAQQRFFIAIPAQRAENLSLRGGLSTQRNRCRKHCAADRTGSFDEFELFNRALNDAEVRELYFKGKPGM